MTTTQAVVTVLLPGEFDILWRSTPISEVFRKREKGSDGSMARCRVVAEGDEYDLVVNPKRIRPVGSAWTFTAALANGCRISNVEVTLHGRQLGTMIVRD